MPIMLFKHPCPRSSWFWAIVVTNIVIVPQSMVSVIERLGSYLPTWTAGLHVKIPFVERVAKKGRV